MNVWLFVRISGIAVGIATPLRLATMQGLITYDALFQSWMDSLSDIVELDFLTKLIGLFLHWGIDFVRSFGISVPDLQEVWRPIFVLNMLLLGAMARNSSVTSLVLFAPMIAIAGAIYTGLTGSAGLGLVIGLSGFIGAFIISANGGGLVAILVVLVMLVIDVNLAGTIGVDSLGVVGVLVAVVAVAVVSIIWGLVENSLKLSRELYTHPAFNCGVDILSVMFGSLIVASIFASPPVW